MSVNNLIQALGARSFETVKKSSTEKRVRLIGRVHDSKTQGWLVVARHILLQQPDQAWTCDLSKWYFMRGPSLVFGWRLLFEAENIAEAIPHIITAVNGAPKARMVVTEIPLPGVTSLDRNKNRAAGIESKKYPAFHVAAGRR